MNIDNIEDVNNSATFVDMKKQRLIAGIISGLILILIIIFVYIFFIKTLQAEDNEEIKFLSLSDSVVLELWNKIDHFDDWYNSSSEPEYEKFINEFYGLDKKTANGFSDELKQFLGISSNFDYNKLNYKDSGGIETAELSIPDFRDSMNSLFGTTGEIDFVPFGTGECHFGTFSTIEDSLMLNVTRNKESCVDQNSNLITELVTAQKEDSRIVFEVQIGFIYLDNGNPILYTSPSKTGQVSGNISEFNKNGDYTSVLTSYKNNLNLYRIIFEYTGTNYRFNSVERIK